MVNGQEIMNAEQNQIAWENMNMMKAQVNAQANAMMDSSLAQAEMQDIQSSRQFYLEYERSIEDLERYWRGFVKNDGRWQKPKDPRPIMTDTAASALRGILESVLNKVVRLSNYQQEDVNRLTFQGRDMIESWLMTDGLFVYNIEANQFEGISYQCEMIILSSLKWAWNAGGRNFMTTSSRTIETVGQFMNNMQQKPMMNADQFKPNKNVFNFWKRN